MSIDIKVPAVGESINEVFIGEWHVAEGDWIEVDQPVVGLETDKATFDVPAPKSGVITKIVKGAGEEAAIGEIIAQLEPGEAPAGAKVKSDEKSTSGSAEKKTAAGGSSETDIDTIVMPAAARAMAEMGISADDVTPTGPGGRMLKEDVLRAADKPAAADRTSETATAPSENGRLEKTVPMSPIRRRIAERLVEAQQNAALLTTFNEIDMSAVKAARARYQDAFREKVRRQVGLHVVFRQSGRRSAE